jgi:hypothetical protein
MPGPFWCSMLSGVGANLKPDLIWCQGLPGALSHLRLVLIWSQIQSGIGIYLRPDPFWHQATCYGDLPKDDPEARIHIIDQSISQAHGTTQHVMEPASSESVAPQQQEAFTSECIDTFVAGEKPLVRHGGLTCTRLYLKPNEKRYVLTVCMQELPLSQPGPGVIKCREWLNNASVTDLPSDTKPETMVELCKRFRRYMKNAINNKAAEQPIGTTGSMQVQLVPEPLHTPAYLRVALHLNVAPELLVTPLPPDDLCLFYAPIAAVAGSTWMESRSSVGYLVGDTMKNTQKQQEIAAKRLKQLLIDRTYAAGDEAEAKRLSLGGRDGWPSEDNFQELAEVLQCRLQCFSLDMDACSMPHALVGSSDRPLLNIGHYKAGHFVLLAGSTVPATYRIPGDNSLLEEPAEDAE